MKNKEKNYNLNLDLLVPFFLIGDEEIKNRAWFNANKEEYEEVVKECYGSISTTLEDNKQIVRWENKNWSCRLLDKEILFILEKRGDSKWKEVKFIEKIFFSNWNIEKNSFELQIKKTIETCLKERMTSLPEQRIKFKLRFHGKSEPNRPDILITLVDDKSSEIKKR